jgi:ATP-dependent DNA ligase
LSHTADAALTALPETYLSAPTLLRSHALPAGFIVPCLPTSAAQPPSGEPWLHEIKQDGFRMIARRILQLYLAQRGP